jgi:hypothetical protein
MTLLPGVNRASFLNSAVRYLRRNYSPLSASEQGRVLPHPTFERGPDCAWLHPGYGTFTSVMSSTSQPVESCEKSVETEVKSNPAILGID